MKSFAQAVVCGSLLFSAQVMAATIDLIGLPDNFDQATFGASGSEYYGQSLVALDHTWQDLTFGVTDTEGGTFNLIITEARAGTLDPLGYLPDADSVVYQSTLTHDGGGLQFFDNILNLSVNEGSTYFFLLQGFGGTLAGASVRATEYQGTDQYAQGTFVYSNDNTGLTNSLYWTSRYNQNEDLAFRTAFVPVPAAVWLFGSALAGLGWVGRRRVRG